MKKLMTLLAIAFTVNAYAQKFVFCEIVGTEKPFTTKVTVTVDFGQKTQFFSDRRMKDANGKTIVFNSMIDAMNFMGKDGWEFVQSYAVSASANTSVYHYVMKKQFTDLSDEEKKEYLSNNQ